MKKIEQDLEAVDNLEKARNNFFKEVGKKVVGQTEILEHLLLSLIHISEPTRLRRSRMPSSA